MRDKGEDYGIDAEIEIFGTDDKATGLLFWAQLRGTDDVSHARSLSLSIDQLNYYNNLDLPVLIVRYCRPTDEIFIKWHFTIKPTEEQFSQKTMTVHFSLEDLWTEATPAKLNRLMRSLRHVQRIPATQPVLIDLRNNGMDASSFFRLESELDRFCSRCSLLTPVASPPASDALVIDILAGPGAVAVSLVELGSYAMEFDPSAAETAAHLCLYGTTAILHDLKVTAQASIIARQLLVERTICPLRFVAGKACLALSDTPSDLLALARQNELETETDWASFLVTMTLMRRASALSEFKSVYDEWLDAQAPHINEDPDQVARAAWAYSRANSHFNQGNLKDAFALYNQARKYSPEYWKTEYFPLEIAACLFDLKRFGLARKIYTEAVKLGGDAQLSLYLGDAHFFYGAFSDAHVAYSDAKKLAGRSPLGLEARLKQFIAGQMASMFSRFVVLKRRQASDDANKISEDDPDYAEKLIQIWTTANPIDPQCNFNPGVYRSRRGEYDQAMGHFLVSAISAPDDIESWVNATLCAYNLQNTEESNDILLTILGVSIHRAGLPAYTSLRSKFAENGMPEEGLATLDSIARELRRPGNSLL